MTAFSGNGPDVSGNGPDVSGNGPDVSGNGPDVFIEINAVHFCTKSVPRNAAPRISREMRTPDKFARNYSTHPNPV